MRLKIDTSICVGHGLCYMHAPQLIEPDDSGYGKARDEDREIPDELIESARRAQRNCPEEAVILSP